MPSKPLAILLWGTLLLATTGSSQAELHLLPPETGLPSSKPNQGVFVVDGSVVHNVGELQLNITNWGLIGSRPNLPSTFGDAPSAMWPAGSGVDYLFAAGLWIGGIKNGVPAVSTGQFENEFLPTPDPTDTIYRTAEGQLDGSRYPFPDEDDDGDGRVNEDPKDGIDNDGDGRIDEDFAAISEQHFRFKMRDNLSVSTEQWPDHDPLDVEVVQESFQWSNNDLEDAIAFQYSVKNIGTSDIENIVVGLFADGDIGARDGSSISIDDMVGFWEGNITAPDGAPLSLSLAYMYDCDGDDGTSEGYLGIMFLNASPVLSPGPRTGFRSFAGTAPFDRGGDPTTDAERYDVLSAFDRDNFSQDCATANDYRMLISTRPSGAFRLRPGRSFVFQTAILVGDDLDDLIDNAANLTMALYGDWFDRDQDPSTGTRGRETRICLDQFGDPRDPLNPLYNLFIDCGYPPDCTNPFSRAETIGLDDLDDDGCVWIDADCAYEEARGALCGTCRDYVEGLTTGFACTGENGEEFHVRWLAKAPPPAPPMRVWESSNEIHVFWDSRSERVRDPILDLSVFEGYRIWRSDNWTRPPGSSVETGPQSTSWGIIAEFDEVSQFENRQGATVETISLGANTGLDPVLYVPQVLRVNSPTAQEFAPLEQLLDQIITENPDLPFGGPIRFVDARGAITELGEQYPSLSNWECCYAQVDTLAWSKQGMKFYEFTDRDVTNGIYYFYAVSTTTLGFDADTSPPTVIGYGPEGRPRGNFRLAIPRSQAQSAEDRALLGQNIFVVPNPATNQSLAEFSQLNPNAQDPSGVRVEFRNLPRARNKVSIFTLAGDLIEELDHDGRSGNGSLAWNLVSRNGQQIVSGIYLFAVESAEPGFKRVIGRFVVVL